MYDLVNYVRIQLAGQGQDRARRLRGRVRPAGHADRHRHHRRRDGFLGGKPEHHVPGHLAPASEPQRSTSSAPRGWPSRPTVTPWHFLEQIMTSPSRRATMRSRRVRRDRGRVRPAPVPDRGDHHRGGRGTRHQHVRDVRQALRRADRARSPLLIASAQQRQRARPRGHPNRPPPGADVGRPARASTTAPRPPHPRPGRPPPRRANREQCLRRAARPAHHHRQPAGLGLQEHDPPGLDLEAPRAGCGTASRTRRRRRRDAGTRSPATRPAKTTERLDPEPRREAARAPPATARRPRAAAPPSDGRAAPRARPAAGCPAPCDAPADPRRRPPAAPGRARAAVAPPLPRTPGGTGRCRRRVRAAASATGPPGTARARCGRGTTR